ncbi:MAG: hypothetical protein WKF75_14460 [Singulisphaera sp.]
MSIDFKNETIIDVMRQAYKYVGLSRNAPIQLLPPSDQVGDLKPRRWGADG